MQLSRNFKVAIGVLAVLALAAFGVYCYQFVNGLGVTGMSNGTSWGLYIACFMFLVGLSAGGLIVASSASIFHVTEYKKVALPAVIVSTVCICLAGAFVLIDLGGIVRVWNMFLTPNFASPLLWDMTVITCYLIINLVYLYFMTSKKADQSKVAIVSRFALPVAILVHSVTAWIFGLHIAREGWHTAIMAPLFVASAMDSGLAILLLALIWLNRRKIFATSKKLIANLAGLLATCIAVDGYMVGCEVLTTAYPGTEHANELLGEMFFGATAPFFWFEIICGVIVPFCILVFAKNRQRTGLVDPGVCRRGARRVLQALVAPVHELHPPQRHGRARPHLRLERSAGERGRGRVGGRELVRPHAAGGRHRRGRVRVRHPGVHPAGEEVPALGA